MFVYLHGERQRSGSHRLWVCPAGDKEGLRGQEPAAEWLDDNEEKTPRTMAVDFLGGRADVPKNLGDYMVMRGIAQPHPASSLITSARKLWNA